MVERGGLGVLWEEKMEKFGVCGNEDHDRGIAVVCRQEDPHGLLARRNTDSLMGGYELIPRLKEARGF